MASTPRRDRGHPEEPCRNCGDATVAEYCPRCGQRKVDVRVSLRVLVQDLVEDQFGVERRTPATLFALFFRPGFLTREYLDGRVVRYVRPFKLYLVSSLLLFLAVGFLSMRGVDGIQQGIQQGIQDGFQSDPEVRAALGLDVERTGADTTTAETTTADTTTADTIPAGTATADTLPTGPWTDRIQARTGNARVDALLRARLDRLGRMEPFDAVREVARTALNYAPTLLFLLLPVFAGVLKLLYLRSGRFYAEHFVFVLHTHAFLFGIFLVGILAGALGLGSVPGLLLLWAAVYVFMAMKRVYGQGKTWTFIKYWSLGWAYLWIVAITFPLLLVVSLFAAG